MAAATLAAGRTSPLAEARAGEVTVGGAVTAADAIATTAGRHWTMNTTGRTGPVEGGGEGGGADDLGVTQTVTRIRM